MKKILSMVLVLVLVAGIAVSGTMAYLTDRDNETNVFTVGDVDIELEGTFAKGVELLPGKTVDINPVIKNVGKSDAWVWLTYAVPAGFEDAVEFGAAGEGWATATSTEDDEYTIYSVLHTDALAAGDSTTAAFSTIGLDETIDITPDGDWYSVKSGIATPLGWKTSNGAPAVYVNAYAIQTEIAGVDSAAVALEAYKGQWGSLNGEMEELTVTEVATADELTDALEDGGIVVLTKDVELTDNTITIPADTNAVLNLNGNTFNAKSTSNTTSKAIEVKNGATLTISGGMVSFYATTPDTEWGGEGQPPYPGYANNTINLAGKLVLENVTVENTTAAGGASYAIDCYPGADLVINDGAVIKGYDKCAIRMFANSATVPTNVTINGGEISGKRAVWVQLPSSNSAVAPTVNLTINGGVLTADTTKDVCIYSYSYGNSFANTNVTITGGTFNGDVCFGGGYKGDQETVVVTGGTFNGYLGRYLANDGWEDIAKP